MDHVMPGLDGFDAVIFDLGNTLLYQANPGTPFDDLRPVLKPGVEELLAFLENRVKLAIVSNTTELTSQNLRTKLVEVGIDHIFTQIISTKDIGIHKPDPAPITFVLKRLRVDPSRSLYIGDLETDKLAALLAGTRFMYATPDLFVGFTQYLANQASAFSRAVEAKIEFNTVISLQIAKTFDSLVKPPGSLGKLEFIVGQIAGIEHDLRPTVDPAAIAIFVADHGIAADDSVTPWPQVITGKMAEQVVLGKAAISILAQNADAYLQVIDVGTIATTLSADILDFRIAAGTKDFRFGKAMSLKEVEIALEVGAETAERLIAGGSKFIAIGEIGIGNTTSSAALISFLTGIDAIDVTGFGSGIDPETHKRKVEIVREAVKKVPIGADAFELLSQIGGFETAAMVGLILRAATLRVPVLLDGVTTVAAALVAKQINPLIGNFLVASHNSAEPGATIGLRELKIDPILDLGLRLGEGTGAALAIPLLRGVCLALEKMERIENII
ncbi:CobT NaMN,DMB phosphoribosyltransferase [Candidatus Nanopelagicaceae bacterium]